MKRYDNEILDEREPEYGSYQENADIIQRLKLVVRGHNGWHKISNDKKQSIDMICTKIGRIITGNPENQDSWDDIAGYAELISVQIDEVNQSLQPKKS